MKWVVQFGNDYLYKHDYALFDSDTRKVSVRSYDDIVALEPCIENLTSVRNAYLLKSMQVGIGEDYVCNSICTQIWLNRGGITYGAYEFSVKGLVKVFDAVTEACIFERSIVNIRDIWVRTALLPSEIGIQLVSGVELLEEVNLSDLSGVEMPLDEFRRTISDRHMKFSLK